MAIISSHQPESEAPSPTPKKARPREALLSGQELPQDTQEESLRPQTLNAYIGQRELKEVLTVATAAARSRGEALDHLLFYGPPGLGKTTISQLLAREMGVNFKMTSAPALESPKDIAGILVALQAKDILFIDEIHRLARVTEEILYTAMEDFRLDIVIGKGRTSRITSVPLPRFTLVGATTRYAALAAPLRDRFGLVHRLRFYDQAELTQIVLRTSNLLKVPIEKDGAEEIARRARGTPRIANRLLRRVRDYAEVKGNGTVTQAMAQTALELFEVDPRGLNWTDRRILEIMIENYRGGPVGLDTLAAATGEDRQTIEDVYEPYLMQIDYLQRTARGRMATPRAYAHLGYKPELQAQQQLLDLG
ncbi:Holliday junction branch migration DNA helicase RuvB [Candidatus Cyanaurora vandensis]|uniref:Holliday junction branch migration DNA helicase RuvB n=1 Tax=Candidatus Cyanaurora vandensis TaxID=2714958 RepID=UPI002579B681|nr:Holliday junction branch migration DNA helicase RuvB [Candidatus Cyanaurora vandensis]